MFKSVQKKVWAFEAERQTMTPRMISTMNVSGVQHLVERAYRESGPLQFLRELMKNGEEAGATHIEFGPEWQAVERLNVYRMMYADNGCGMGPEEIETFLNTFGGGGKAIGDAHENYGVGSKTSLLPWNQHGVVVISYTETNPDGSMLWMCRNTETGEYGARSFETDDGEFVNVVIPFDDDEEGIDWRVLKPSWLTTHGTIVVCLGDTGREHTFVTKGGDTEAFGTKGISAYLNKRLWALPEGLEIHAQELRSNKPSEWPRSYAEASAGTPPSKGSVDRRWNKRRIRGAEYFVEYDKATAAGHLQAKGTLCLSDGTEMDWYLWEGERPRVHSYAYDKGFIAALYKGELYDYKNHHKTFNRFGINTSDVRERLTLIARPPKAVAGAFGVYPDTARNSLKVMGCKRAGEALPWDQWSDEFAQNMPAPIIQAIIASQPSSAGSIDDEKWRERLADRFGARWRHSMFRVDPKGTSTTDPADPGGSPGTKKPKKASSIQKPGTRGGVSGALSKGTNPGAEPASKTQAGRGIPEFRWVGTGEFQGGVAATFTPSSAANPMGLVLLNQGFQPFVEVIQYWVNRYPDHFAAQVRDVVENVYGQSMVARIAHSQSLVKDPNWGQRRVVNSLRSDEALTMAALGLISEDHVIDARLRRLLTSRKKAVA